MSGNPLVNMMAGGNPIQAMLQNSPIGQVLNMIKSGGNPQDLIQQMMSKNPQMQQAMQMINNKDQNQINKFIANTAKEKGVDLTELAGQIGMPPEIAKKYGIDIK